MTCDRKGGVHNWLKRWHYVPNWMGYCVVGMGVIGMWVAWGAIGLPLEIVAIAIVTAVLSFLSIQAVWSFTEGILDPEGTNWFLVFFSLFCTFENWWFHRMFGYMFGWFG